MLRIIYVFLFIFIFVSIEAIPFWNKLRYTRDYDIRSFYNVVQAPDNRYDYYKQKTKDINSQSSIVANIILSSMNKSVNPCDNFYDYACGSWAKNYPLPSDRNSWDLDSALEFKINVRLRDILTEEVKPSDTTPLKYEKLWYQSCMNLAKLEEDGIKPLEDVINRIGGWPMSTSNRQNNIKSWQQVHNYYMAFDEINALYDVIVGHDVRNSSGYIIMLDQPANTLYEDMLNDENVEYSLNKYKNFMKKVAVIFAKSASNEISIENISKDVDDVMEFEKKWHLIKSTADSRADFEYSQNYMTIKELQEFYDEKHHETSNSKINWLDTFKDAFKETNITIDDTEEIQVLDKPYLHKLSDLLDKTPNHVIVNYMHWKFLMYSLEYTNREMIDLAVEAALEHRGFMKESPRWSTCLDDMRSRYGLMYEYVNKYFSEDKQRMGVEMAITIRDRMIQQIQQSSWLDNPTKMKTISKLSKLKIHMGHTKILKNVTFIEHVYDQFKIGSSYCETYQNFRKFQMLRSLQLLRKFDKKNSENAVLMDPLIANAVYEPYTNSLLVTAAQLSISFFDTSIPMYVNYGYVGSIIGHEISHAMDKEGRLFDENGNVKTWWSENMIDEFVKKSECFVHQFNNYSLSGKITLGENMADTTGVQVSYEAYKKISNNSNVKITKLPGLEELNDDQLFFVSYALSYCQTASHQYWIQNSEDVHSPHKYRVIGTVSNLDSFAKAFNCPLGSSMNPGSKCYLWK